MKASSRGDRWLPRWPGVVTLVAATLLAGCSADHITGVAPQSLQRSSAGSTWDQWPWMETRIPAGVMVSARLAGDTVILAYETRLRGAFVRHGACSFAVRLYADSSLNGEPQWDDRPRGSFCDAVGYHIGVPGRSEERVRRIAFSPGRYFAAVAIRLEGESVPRLVPAGPIQLP